ncbi:hypothetical protein K504DRAFT_508912 [Pleomassaria siparia CBS 279.74]|uniref:Uncharacterized protein n=1 Tax=Pleomassaria siparia CBS 279.74 TaxID=1314801 RepID=A0A6G1JQR1_9PLEO|nr:hypothetical protein K504DRAFT_508912 [Pleomassaria siparia CBS 279.74]
MPVTASYRAEKLYGLTAVDVPAALDGDGTGGPDIARTTGDPRACYACKNSQAFLSFFVFSPLSFLLYLVTSLLLPLFLLSSLSTLFVLVVFCALLLVVPL